MALTQPFENTDLKELLSEYVFQAIVFSVILYFVSKN